MTVPRRHVDHGCPLRNLVAVVEQAGNEELAVVGVTKHDTRTLIGRNEPDRVATLFVSHRRHLPRFYFSGRIGIVHRRTSLRLVQIVGRAPTGCWRRRARRPSHAVAETVDRTVHAVHRERIAVAIRDRTISVYGLRAKNCADCFQPRRTTRRDAGGETSVHCKIRRVVDGDEQSAVLNELLQVL